MGQLCSDYSTKLVGYFVVVVTTKGGTKDAELTLPHCTRARLTRLGLQPGPAVGGQKFENYCMAYGPSMGSV